MEKYVIVMVNSDQRVLRKFRFVGDYTEARRYADKLLYSCAEYWGYTVNIDY